MMTSMAQMCHHFIPPMIERGWGRVINISSVEGKHGKPVFTAYTAAKHALVGLTRQLSWELAPHGVTVNVRASDTTTLAT